MASLEALLAANGDKSRADRASARGLARESMLEAEEAVQEQPARRSALKPPLPMACVAAGQQAPRRRPKSNIEGGGEKEKSGSLAKTRV